MAEDYTVNGEDIRAAARHWLEQPSALRGPCREPIESLPRCPARIRPGFPVPNSVTTISLRMKGRPGFPIPPPLTMLRRAGRATCLALLALRGPQPPPA